MSQINSVSRREFVAGSVAAVVAGGLHAGAAERRPPRILLRSSWQTVNIGDIGHTPGALRLLETHIPQAEVTLWPSNIDRGVEPMLRRSFPKLQIVRGRLNERGEPTTDELKHALEQQDFLLHGSGPSVVAHKDVAAWAKTGKPFGIYGVTVSAVDDALRELLSRAAFVFCRDTLSLALLQRSGVTCPAMEFGPDAAFGIHLRDDEKALPFLAAHGLEERKFICVIPRLRYTPYHKIHPGRHDPKEVQRREAVNAQFQDADMAKLREVITAWVRGTGLKALLCPEMTYQLELLQPLLLDPLPDDVKPRVVRRETFWLPDEAGSVYARAHTVVSVEMHSPIIAAAHGTPAIHLRQP
ncbi:MAG: polysaccharide pyruvyl transferase family protein, partial [Planctomycetes bacterium]|nr:polysaccharide pyruvyl transferase family protein [Planctomycetota bacterium]